MKAFTITVSTPKMFNALEYAISVAQGSLEACDFQDRDSELALTLVNKIDKKMANHRQAFKIPHTIQYKLIWSGIEDDPIGKRIEETLRMWERDFYVTTRSIHPGREIYVLESAEQAILCCLSAAGIYDSPNLKIQYGGYDECKENTSNH